MDPAIIDAFLRGKGSPMAGAPSPAVPMPTPAMPMATPATPPSAPAAAPSGPQPYVLPPDVVQFLGTPNLQRLVAETQRAMADKGEPRDAMNSWVELFADEDAVSSEVTQPMPAHPKVEAKKAREVVNPTKISY